MTGCAMKSEAIGADRIKNEGRQSIHRWRMSKIPLIVNGAEDKVGYADGEEIVVRQANPVNLAAAVHDHISCTKSAELRKLPETKDGRVNLPLTDHMYANYNSEKPKGLAMIATVSPPIPQEITDHVRCLEEIVLSQLNLIGKQNDTLCDYQRKIEALEKEFSELSKRVDGCADNGNTGNTEVGSGLSNVTPQPSVSYPALGRHCLTKYCGRSSGRHPSRALKRRNMVLPDKSSKRQITLLSSARPSISSSDIKKEHDDDEKVVKANVTNTIKARKKTSRKRGRKPRTVTWKDDFLHTDKPYYLPDYYTASSPFISAETTIDVPSWRHCVLSVLHNMERTEDVNDYVFEKRHHKSEAEEKFRKKQDLKQQRREMNNMNKLNRKQYCGTTKGTRGNLRKKISFYPSPNDIQYIEVTDTLPVIAFGHLIPVFQPSEFSLPWSIADPIEMTEPPTKCKMVRTSSGQKVT